MTTLTTYRQSPGRISGSRLLTCFALMALLTITAPATAQSRILDSLEFTAGFSRFDRYTIGARYRFGQNNAGSTIGTFHDFYGSYSTALVFSLTYYRHLFGHSKYTHQKPWFVRSSIGYQYGRATELHYTPSLRKFVVGHVYVGRDINFSTRCGLALSATLEVDIFNRYDDVNNRGYRTLHITPGIDALFFYRFKGKKQ